MEQTYSIGLRCTVLGLPLLQLHASKAEVIQVEAGELLYQIVYIVIIVLVAVLILVVVLVLVAVQVLVRFSILILGS